MAWKFHLPGNNDDPECCCGVGGCIPYLPCCLRDFRHDIGIIVSGGPTGSAAVNVERFTVENVCNNQTSVDWSTLQTLDSSLFGGGAVPTVFGGRAGQGCTFGLDILNEHLFCVCEAPDPNFRTRLTLCNPNSFSVTVRHVAPALCFAYNGPNSGLNAGGINRCCLVPRSEPPPTVIASGASMEFTIDWDPVLDRENCLDICFSDGPDFYLEQPVSVIFGNTDLIYNNPPLDRVCLEKLPCDATEDVREFAGTAIDDCEFEDCPPCGCIQDILNPGGCGCSCDSVEALNSCRTPKQVIAASNVSGLITICDDPAAGLGVEGTFVRCINGDCEISAELQFEPGSRLWRYTVFGDAPGPSTEGAVVDEVVDMVPESQCEDYEVEWNLGGTIVELTVNGVNKQFPLDPTFVPKTSGVCYAVERGGAWVLK